MVYKMYRIIFSVIPNKKLGVRDFTETEIQRKLLRIKKKSIKDYFGYTLYEAKGGYMFSQTNLYVIDERTYILEISTDKKVKEIKKFVKEIGRMFKQESVVLITMGKSDLIMTGEDEKKDNKKKDKKNDKKG